MRSGVLSGIWSLAILVPSIAVGVRRLHDIDRSGWWLLAPAGVLGVGAALLASGFFISTALTVIGGILLLLGCVGGIVLLVWACTDGTRGPNRFGPDPKGLTADLEETFR